VSALAWSPDGKTLASAGAADHSIILWDAAAGTMLRRLPELEGHATVLLQFAPDGKALISFGADRVLRVWDVAGGKELRSFVISPMSYFSCAVSHDGKLAALASYDQKIRVWDVDKGEPLHQLDVKFPQGQGNFRFLPLAFAGDGRTLLSFSPYERGTVRRWDAASGKELGQLKGQPFALGVTPWLSADGRGMVTVSGNVTTLTELASGKARHAFSVATAPPPPGGRVIVPATGATLSPDSRVLAVAQGDGTLRFWDTGPAKELAVRKGLAGNPRLLAFAPDGKTLATAGPEAAVTLWDVPAPSAEGRLEAKDATTDKLYELWNDIGGEDATRAWQAILALESAPKEVVPYLEKKLRAEAPPDEKGIAKLIAGLDSEEFQEREDATQALVRAGPTAEAAVKKALENKPSAEAKQRLEFILNKMSGKLGPDVEEVRVVRAVEVLERVGTPEARKVLEEFAKGGEGRLNVEARAAAERLRAKSRQ
jgi:WD40 repeat protein